MGIGTDNPSKTLHVEGNVHITKDLNILGNILIQGETTTVETTNLNIQDPIIELGKNNSLGTDLGIIMTRPGSNVAVSFLEASDELVMAYTESHSGVSSIVPITSEDLKLKVYGDLTTTGNVTATYLHGDGSELTGIFDTNTVAIGRLAGETAQGSDSVAIGNVAGQTTQGSKAVAVGNQAGETSQGTAAVAVGDRAGQTSQHDNSIVLNASGSALNTTGVSRFYVKPIRSVASGSSVLTYDDSTGEIMNTTDFAPQSTTYTKTEVDSAISSASLTLNDIYPVGSIYFTASAISPSTSIGGTWVRYAQGKCLFGVDDADTDFALETTGGVKDVILTEAQMPSHRHTFFDDVRDRSGSGGGDYVFNLAGFGARSGFNDATNYAGSSQAHENLPPYIAIYIWKRTA